MNWRFWINLFGVLALVNLFACIQPAEATSYADRSLPELYQTAGWLISGSVESQHSECKQEHCFYKSTFVIAEKIKGSLDKPKICVCSLNPLEVRENYYVFLVSAPAKDSFGIECEYLALEDGIIRPDSLGDYWRHMSPNGLGRQIRFESDVYITSEIRDPLFAVMLGQWKEAKLDAK